MTKINPEDALKCKHLTEVRRYFYLRSSSFLDSRWYAVMRRRTRPFNSDGAGNGKRPSLPLPAAESSSLPPDGFTEGARDSDGVFELEPRLMRRRGRLDWTSYYETVGRGRSLMRKQPGSRLRLRPRPVSMWRIGSSRQTLHSMTL